MAHEIPKRAPMDVHMLIEIGNLLEHQEALLEDMLQKQRVQIRVLRAIRDKLKDKGK